MAEIKSILKATSSEGQHGTPREVERTRH
jgi:hypothetical protein